MSLLERQNTAYAGPLPWNAEQSDLLAEFPRRSPGHPTPTPDIAREDWDILFHAVLERLETLTNKVSTSTRRPHDGGGPAEVLRECIAALEQLRRSAGRDGSRPPQAT